jgi:hypothetical protein
MHPAVEKPPETSVTSLYSVQDPGETACLTHANMTTVGVNTMVRGELSTALSSETGSGLRSTVVKLAKMEGDLRHHTRENAYSGRDA